MTKVLDVLPPHLRLPVSARQILKHPQKLVPQMLTKVEHAMDAYHRFPPLVSAGDMRYSNCQMKEQERILHLGWVMLQLCRVRSYSRCRTDKFPPPKPQPDAFDLVAQPERQRERSTRR